MGGVTVMRRVEPGVINSMSLYVYKKVSSSSDKVNKKWKMSYILI